MKSPFLVVRVKPTLNTVATIAIHSSQSCFRSFPHSSLDIVVMIVWNDLSQDMLEINALTDRKTLLDRSNRQVLRSVGSRGHFSRVLCLHLGANTNRICWVVVMQMYLLLLICYRTDQLRFSGYLVNWVRSDGFYK